MVNSCLFNFSEEELEYYPLNIMTVQKRFQIFIMMVLGEAVIQVLQPHFEDNFHDSATRRGMPYAVSGFFLAFAYAMLYSEACLKEHEHEHALHRSKLAGAVWYWIHIPIAVALLYMGIAVKIAYYYVLAEDEVSDYANKLLGCACGISMLLLMICRMTHKGTYISIECLSLHSNYGFSYPSFRCCRIGAQKAISRRNNLLQL